MHAGCGTRAADDLAVPPQRQQRQWCCAELQRLPDLRRHLRRERDLRLEAPVRDGGEQHDAAPVDDIGLAAQRPPIGLDLVELDLDHDDPQRIPGIVDAAGDVEARALADRAERILLRRAAGNRAAEIVPERIIITDEARRLPPVAGGNRDAVLAQHIDHRRPGLAGDRLQLEVERMPVAVPQRRAHVWVTRQDHR